jgi:hypothetical protein
MEITEIHHCKLTDQVTIKTTQSSKAITATALGILKQDAEGRPIHIVLDRLVFDDIELKGMWQAKGCFVTELVRHH